MEKTEAKKIDFVYLSSASLDWARKVTFSPFSLKKIFILAFVAWLGAGIQGYNLSYWPHPHTPVQNVIPISPGSLSGKKTHAVALNIKVNDPNSAKAEEKPVPFKYVAIADSLYPAAMGVVVFLITLFVAIVFIFSWLSARFTFIFLDDTLKNDASIHGPFYQYKQEGNSLFKFNLLWGMAFLVMLCLAFATISNGLDLGYFFTKDIVTFMSQNILFTIALGVIAFAAWLFFTFTYDFAVPVMYHDRIKIISAWKIVFSKFKDNKKNILLYLVLKVGLSICAMVLAIAVFLIAAAIIVLVGLAGGLIFYALGQLAIKAIPLIAYFFYALAIFTGIIFLFLLFILLLAVMVPVAVFFRIFSIKFLENIGGNYNFFPIRGDAVTAHGK